MAKVPVNPIQSSPTHTKDEKDLSQRLLLDAMQQSRELFDELSDREKGIALEVIEEMRGDPDLKSLKWDYLWELDYKWVPASIEEFMDSEEYLQSVTQSLYPVWREELCRLFEPGSHTYEWILRGAIGTGKSTAAAIAYVYQVYRLSCLRDPHAYYGLMKNSKFTFGIYSITKTQSNDVGYFKVRSFIEDCRYFREKYPFDPRTLSRVSFTKGDLQILPGSRSFHAIGLDLYGFYLDEANFMQARRQELSPQSTGPEGQAESIYNNARTRVKSRFLRKGGYVPGLVVLLSSERGTSDFLSRHVKEVQPEIDNNSVRVTTFSQWEAKGHLSMFSGEKFKVQVGDRIHPSRILTDGTMPNKGCQIVDVPVEFLGEFTRDVDGAIRDIAGIPTTGICPFIRDKTILTNCVVPGRKHPFTRESVTLDYRRDFDLHEFFLMEELFTVNRSQYRARLSPTAPRFIHVDLALTGDCAAIAMSHVSGMVSVKRNRADGTFYADTCPSITVDFMLQIRPPHGSEIDLAKIRAFIISLRDLGVPIVRVSFDGFQSADSKQVLIKSGFDAVVLSVDRTDEPYMILRQCFTEGRINWYHYAVVIRELSFLERDLDKQKVDHPKINPDGTLGSKDVADALCGSVYHCMVDERAGRPAMELGGERRDILPEQGVVIPGGVLRWGELEREAGTQETLE